MTSPVKKEGRLKASGCIRKYHEQLKSPEIGHSLHYLTHGFLLMDCRVLRGRIEKT